MATLGRRLVATLARCGGARRGLGTTTAPACRAMMLSEKHDVGRPHGALQRWKWQAARWLVTYNRNPYAILGVPKGEHLEAIKATYLKLAKEHHPDSDGGDAEVFKELASAMREILLERRHLNGLGSKGGDVAHHDRPLHSEFDPGFIFDFVRDSLDSARLKREVKDMTKDMQTAGPDMGGWFFMAEMIAAGTDTSGTGNSRGRGKRGGRIAEQPPSLHASGTHQAKNTLPHHSASSTDASSSSSTGSGKDSGTGRSSQ